MKSKQIIGLAVVGALTAGAAYYFRRLKGSLLEKKQVKNNADSQQPDPLKRIPRAASPIRKFTHKAKVSAE